MASRQDRDLQLIYGRNPILDALDEGKSFERIYMRDNLTGELEKLVRQRCKELEIPLKKVPLVKLDRLAHNRNHQGVVGIGSIITYQEIDMMVPHLYEQGIDPILMLLDNVQDVRNIGAIARSAEAFGAHGLIISGKQAGMITHDSLKASAGALARIHVCREKNTIKTIEALRAHGIKTVGTTLAQSTPIYDTEFSAPICLLLGSEGDGLHKSVEQACDQLISIPQSGDTDSLNVSVAAGVVLYEVQRQLAKTVK